MRQRIAFFVVLLSALVCTANDWPTFRGNLERTGFSSERVGFPSGAPVWQFRARSAFVSSPAIDKDVLFIGCRDSSLYALSASTGALLWQRKMQGWFDSSPAVHGDSVVVGCLDNYVYVFSRTSGEWLDEFSAGFQLSSPAVLADGTILSLIGYPYNAFGKFEGHTATSPWSLSFPQPMYSSIAVSGNKAVFGGNDGTLYCVNLSDNGIAWSLAMAGTTYLSTPAISQGLVFFAPGDYDRSVYAVWLSDGALYWQSAGKGGLSKKNVANSYRIPDPIMGKLQHMTPAQRTQWLGYYRAKGASFTNDAALAKTGVGASGNWVAADNRVHTSSVAVDSNNVYVVQRELGYTNIVDMVPQSRFTLLALDKSTGNEVWRFEDYRTAALSGYNASPAVVGNKLYVGWGEGKLYAVSTRDGSKQWEDSLGSDIFSSPAVSGNRLYVGTTAGILSAFELNATAQGVSFQTSVYCYPNPARGNVSHIQFFAAKAGEIDMTLYTFADKPVLKFSRRFSAEKNTLTIGTFRTSPTAFISPW